MAKAGPLDYLRSRAARAIVENSRQLARLADVRRDSPLTTEQRAARFWDIPAKIDASRRIRDEEYLRAIQDARAGGSFPPHNDIYDAQRHARWSQRTAQVAGPMFADTVGVLHELDNIGEAIGRTAGAALDNERPYDPRTGVIQTLREVPMDLHNNAEGRQAAAEGRAIDPGRLRLRP